MIWKCVAKSGDTPSGLEDSATSPAARGRRKAFTLVEVLLALALLVGLIGALWVFLGNLQLSQRAVADEVERQVAATRILDCLEQQLAQSIAGVPGGGAETGAGVTGSALGLRILARGVPIVVQGSPDQPLGGDLVGTTLAFDEGSSTMMFEQRTIGGGGSSVSARVGSVGAMRLRYFDGSTWSEAFDSAARGGLPPAVEVSIWFNKPETEEGALQPSVGTGEAGESGTAGEVPAALPNVPTVPADRVRIISIPDAAALSEKAA